MINIVLGIVQLLSIIFISIYELKNKSISMFLWGTLLVMFGLPHFFAIVTQISDYNDDIIIKSSIFVILFNLLYIGSKILLNRLVGRTNRYDMVNIKNLNNCENIRSQKRLKIICFILLIVSFLILAFYSTKYLGGISNGSWGAYKNLGAELGLFSLNRYGTFVFFASAGISLIFWNKKRYVLTLISMCIIIAYALITGNRIIILPILVVFILKYSFFNNKNISIKSLVILGIMGFISIYTVYFLRLLRIYGGFYNMFLTNSIVDLIQETTEMILGGDGELALRNAFYHFIYYDNNFNNFNKGYTYIRLLLIAFPTSILNGIKPPDFAISMGSAWAMDPSNTTYSMHPTLYGDVFANLWWFGILLGVFWAFFIFLIDKFINKNNNVVKIMLMVLFGTVYVIVGRGSVYNGFYIAFLGCIIILGSNFVSRLRI